MLPIIALHRRYVRTCRSCGNTWVVSRAVAAGGLGSLGVTNQARDNGRATRGARAAGGTVMHMQTQGGGESPLRSFNQAMRLCNRCGVDDFDQRPLRRSEPTEP